jgi:hypothetical protein
MSVDFNGYLGPYVECKIRQVTYTYEKDGCCTNAHCKYQPHQPPGWSPGDDENSQGFCFYCGKPLGTVRLSSQKDNVDSDWEFEQNDGFWTTAHGDFLDWDDKCHIWWRCDQSDLWCGEFEPKCDGFMSEIHHPTTPNREICALEACEAQLEDLRALYGKNNVEVKWGLFLWAN